MLVSFLPCQTYANMLFALQPFKLYEIDSFAMTFRPHRWILGGIAGFGAFFAFQTTSGVLHAATSPSPTPSASERTVVFKWNPPTSGVKPLGYKVFWGTGSGNYQNVRDVKDVLTCSIILQKSQKYYVASRAYTMGGESNFSNQVIVPALW